MAPSRVSAVPAGRRFSFLQKSNQQYSSDAVVKFGFCRGIEPVNYVSNILERFNRYKQFGGRSPVNRNQ